MATSVIELIKLGQGYMNAWPLKPELARLFPENRVIYGTRLSINVMPPVAVLSSSMLVNINGMDYLPQALAVAALILSFPLQGLLWLGNRSQQSLSPGLRAWYREIHHRMQLKGCKLQAAVSRPSYLQLAELLKRAFEELDSVFKHEIDGQ